MTGQLSTGPTHYRADSILGRPNYAKTNPDAIASRFYSTANLRNRRFANGPFSQPNRESKNATPCWCLINIVCQNCERFVAISCLLHAKFRHFCWSRYASPFVFYPVFLCLLRCCVFCPIICGFRVHQKPRACYQLEGQTHHRLIMPPKDHAPQKLCPTKIMPRANYAAH